jgi:hypothetical protein
LRVPWCPVLIRYVLQGAQERCGFCLASPPTTRRSIDRVSIGCFFGIPRIINNEPSHEINFFLRPFFWLPNPLSITTSGTPPTHSRQQESYIAICSTFWITYLASSVRILVASQLSDSIGPSERRSRLVQLPDHIVTTFMARISFWYVLINIVVAIHKTITYIYNINALHLRRPSLSGWTSFSSVNINSSGGPIAHRAL